MKTILIYSGGLDSTCLLQSLLSECRGIADHVKCVGFNYGQRHKRELNSATNICTLLGIEFRQIDLSQLAPMLRSSQTDFSIPVPHGHYADENMKKTVVPNRNMIMLAIAAGWCISENFDRVAFGAHAGDHAIYPDCRPGFALAMGQVFDVCDYKKVDLHVPFIHLTKGGCLERGKHAGITQKVLAMTWSCYEGKEYHCGKCGACTERKEAFKSAGMIDPTSYVDRMTDASKTVIA